MSEDEKLKQELIEQLRSGDQQVVKQSIATLRERVWLADGTLIGTNLSEADLIKADLSRGNLSEVDLIKTDLSWADLSWADLSRADLSSANLIGANLSEAHLIGANLSEAHLIGANLSEANLSRANLNRANLIGVTLNGADFNEARCRRTIFADVDLSGVKGLGQVKHNGPSTIGIDTLFLSQGRIPEFFLHGCGVPEAMISFAKSLAGQPVDSYLPPQIFVSYSRNDWDSFVQPLVSHLRPLGFNTWIDQDFLRGGDDWMDKINEALDESRYLILCVSPDALKSKYVRMEYREFYHNNKTIIPVICHPVADMPAELNGIQYQPYDLDAIAERLRTLIDTEGAKKLPPVPKL